jgi:MFS family permease
LPLETHVTRSVAAERSTWPLLAGVIASVSVFAIAQGLTYPLLSFILAEQGISPTVIGLSAAMTPLGLIASSFFMPWLARRFGSATLVINAVWLATFTLALIALIPDVIVWFPLRFLLGAAINPLFVLSETWMIVLAPPQQRGRVMGIYHDRNRRICRVRFLPLGYPQSTAEPCRKRRRGVGRKLRR